MIASVWNSLKEQAWFKHRLWGRYAALVHEDPSATYTREIEKWLIVSPIVGVISGVVVTGARGRRQ